MIKHTDLKTDILTVEMTDVLKEGRTDTQTVELTDVLTEGWKDY